MNETVHVATGDALLIVDVQYDFRPGGALPIAEGDRIIPPVINHPIQLPSVPS